MAGERTGKRLTIAEERKIFRAREIDDDIEDLRATAHKPFHFYSFGPEGMPDLWGAARQPQREANAIERAARSLKSLARFDAPEGTNALHFQQYARQIAIGVNHILYNRGRQVTTIGELERNLQALRRQHDPEELDDDLDTRTLLLGAQSMVTIAKLVLQKLEATFNPGPGQNGHTPH